MKNHAKLNAKSFAALFQDMLDKLGTYIILGYQDLAVERPRSGGRYARSFHSKEYKDLGANRNAILSIKILRQNIEF